MKISKVITFLLAGFLCLPSFPAASQIFKKLQEKVEKKVTETAEKAIDGALGDSEADQTGSNSDPLKGMPKTVYDFTPGNRVIFEDDFSSYQEGTMPRTWKSTGNGTVTSVPGFSGKWLMLFNDQVYQLVDATELPKNFTIEFDILPQVEETSNLRDYFHFGLQRNNNLDQYMSRAVAAVNPDYYDSQVAFGSERGDKTAVEFPLSNYGNRIMHVEIQVNGNWMKVFFDKYKVLDTDMLYPESSKYFYLNAPGYGMERDDRLYISNVRIAEIGGAGSQQNSVPSTGSSDNSTSSGNTGLTGEVSMGPSGSESVDSGNKVSFGDMVSVENLPPLRYDFKAGTELIFYDDFSQDELGARAGKWKSSGNSAVISVPNFPGRWMKLYNDQVYQIDGAGELPEDFTVEFDVLTQTDKAGNLRDNFHFGFYRNNNLERYMSRAVAAINPNYYSSEINFKSEVAAKTDAKYPLKNYGNRKMHVEIQVSGNWMKVFIDKYKVLDTDMVYKDSSKYFYLNAPGYGMGRNDHMYISNVRIAAIE